MNKTRWTTMPATGLLVLIVAIALTTTFIVTSCATRAVGPLAGMAAAQAGRFTNLPGGRLYTPPHWSASDAQKWPVTVILHGYGELSISLSNRYFWKEYTDQFGIVLFFVETGHMGWQEGKKSSDTKLVIDVLRGFRKAPWTKRGGIQLFGWSAGAIMALGFLPQNGGDSARPWLFDRLAVYSGGFGVVMTEEIKKNPDLRGIARVPVFFAWGDREPASQGVRPATYLRERGWCIDCRTHPGGHYIDAELVCLALSTNR